MNLIAALEQAKQYASGFESSDESVRDGATDADLLQLEKLKRGG